MIDVAEKENVLYFLANTELTKKGRGILGIQKCVTRGFTYISKTFLCK